MKRVTLDSNIYLSALVFGGKPKRILEMAIEGEIEVAVSDPIIEEVRLHLPGKFGWSDSRTADAVGSISEYARHVTPTEIIDAVPSDADDDRVLECAVAVAEGRSVTARESRELARAPARPGMARGATTEPGSVSV